MKKCHVVYLACTAALVGTGLGAAPSQAVHATHVVRPGQSIQKAVDAARPGDTVLVLSGTYRESVKVTTDGLTLRGTGPGTVIRPGGEKAPDDCAERGNGICVTGAKDRPLRNVTVAALTVTGFDGSGVFAMGTDRLTVRDVTAEKNGVWGIAQQRSERGVLRDNTVRDNGDAGLFLANTITAEEGAADTRGTLVEHNTAEGNRIGVTVRRLRNLSVTGNHLTGNCAGLFVVGDENTPRTGDLLVGGNRVVANNKSCPKTERLPALQGSGIVLTGAEKTRITRNLVADNSGDAPMSGGIVLFKSLVGAVGEQNRIERNTLRGNAPADLVDTETDAVNTFEGNSCAASRPAGLC
ncbi:nitrous oxide reductase family maturation protein NosD [Streptomyces sp. AD55]|uniref:right-handed parallel beta-helix repeat-containing protein n=1 Tax=Streptomyces sp. AD55 TaxID=3242895 RepID=UPI0035275779